MVDRRRFMSSALALAAAPSFVQAASKSTPSGTAVQASTAGQDADPRIQELLAYAERDRRAAHQVADAGIAKTLGIQYADALGIPADGVKDAAGPIRAAIADNRTIIFPPGTYLLDSSSGPVSGVARAPAIVLDGISNFGLVGMPGAVFKIGDNLAKSNSSFIVTMVSAAQAKKGRYTRNIVISGFRLVFNAEPGMKGAISGLNITSAEDVVVENVIFDAGGVKNVGILGITGTGGRGHVFRRNKFINVSTAFDNSQYENCTFEKNRLQGGERAVTGFNHFYDVNTLDNVRLETPLTQAMSSGLLIYDNDISGYPTAIALRGVRDSWIDRNRCHSVSLDSKRASNAISIYTGKGELKAGMHVSGISITRNVVHGYRQKGEGVLRAIFVNRFGGDRPVKNIAISDNIIHDLEGKSVVAVSFDEVADGDDVAGNIIDTATVPRAYGPNIAGRVKNAAKGCRPS